MFEFYEAKFSKHCLILTTKLISITNSIHTYVDVLHDFTNWLKTIFLIRKFY